MSKQTSMKLSHDKAALPCPDGQETPVPGIDGNAYQFSAGYGALSGVIRSDRDIELRVYLGKQGGGQFLGKAAALSVTGATKADGSGIPWDRLVTSVDYELRVWNGSGAQASVDVLAWLKGQS